MLSVIIPTVNEAKAIDALLDQLAHQTGVNLEVIVVDGGSTDATPQVVLEKGAKLLKTQAGRGIQMNQGAEAASGEYLLFLHADSCLTSDRQLASALQEVKQEEEPVAGHFALSFATQDKELKHQLRFFEEKSHLNRPGTWSGDQGLLISRATLNLYDGFWQELPFLEDKDFARKFQKTGRFITCNSIIRTSARRFEREGYLERVIVNIIIMAMFLLNDHHFLNKALGIYRINGKSNHLDPHPFLKGAKSKVFKGDTIQVIQRLYKLSRFAIENAWQIALFLGIRKDSVDSYLFVYEKYIKPWTHNVLCYMIGIPIIIIWIFWKLLKPSYSK